MQTFSSRKTPTYSMLWSDIKTTPADHYGDSHGILQLKRLVVGYIMR